jgi:hypothetical protein
MPDAGQQTKLQPHNSSRASQNRAADEQSFQSVVIEVARLAGWRVAHFRAARTVKGWKVPVTADGAGWPDLVLVRPPRIVLPN